MNPLIELAKLTEIIYPQIADVMQVIQNANTMLSISREWN
jgi:hypothetical protein